MRKHHLAVADQGSPVVAPFVPGGEFTVGAEDELHLVDRAGDLVVGDQQELIGGLHRARLGGCHASPEIFASQIEFGTPVCADAAAVVGSLARARSGLRTAGQSALAAGVHPTARLGSADLTRSTRYEAIADEYAGVLRTPTAAFQVHVGMPDPESLVAAYRGLRNNLPLLRALSAASPYWHGRDSGLASSRAAIIRSYPRVGTPPVLRSYDEYEELVDQEARASEVPDYTYVCWEVRPHPRFGTLEVRVMDAQVSLDHAVGLVALVQGLAQHAVERPCGVDLPTAVLAANDFSALRHGVDARLVAVDGRKRPLRELAAVAIRQARLTLSEGTDGPLEALDARLDGEQEYERHRRIHAQIGFRGLLVDLMDRTVRGTRSAHHSLPSGRFPHPNGAENETWMPPSSGRPGLRRRRPTPSRWLTHGTGHVVLRTQMHTSGCGRWSFQA